MSNSTRQGGYDERLVVPLEASRRGAHRARTNPLVAALPLLVVVVVVAAVIGVAYALFLKPGGDTSANDPTATSPTAPAATSAPAATTQPTTGASKSSSASSSHSSASSSPSAGAVDKTVAIKVYNGTLNNGSTVNGLAGTVSNTLVGAGFKNAALTRARWTATSINETTVFYGKSDQQATAEAIVQALGAGKAVKSSTGSGGIVVVAYSDIKH